MTMDPKYSLSICLATTLLAGINSQTALAQGIQAKRTAPWSPEQEKAGFELADGFVIELVASEKNGLINPIDITFDDAGRLWTQTAEMYPLDPVPGINFGKAMRMMKDEVLIDKDPRFNKVKRLYQLKDKGTDKAFKGQTF